MSVETNSCTGAAIDEITGIAARSDARPYLISAERTEAGLDLVVHGAKGVSSRAARRNLVRDVRRQQGVAKADFRAVTARELDRHKSFESFGAATQGSEILFDPTGFFTRASALVRFAGSVRRELGDRVRAFFWDGTGRQVYVVFNSRRFFADGAVKARDLAEAERVALAALWGACGGEAKNYIARVNLGFEAPPADVVAIDDASAAARKSLFVATRRKIGIGAAITSILGLATLGAAQAQDIQPWAPGGGSLPAVSGMNGKIGVLGGWHDGSESSVTGVGLLNRFAATPGRTVTQSRDTEGGLFAVEGSVAVPLSHAWGAQIDGAIGSLENDTFVGAGGHLFWRDPTKALLGAFGSYSVTDTGLTNGGPNDIELYRFGGEAEIYSQVFTVAARAGHQWFEVDFSSPLGTIGSFDEPDDGFFGDIELTWYATDDFAMSVGGSYDSQTDGALNLGLEYQPALSQLGGLTLFADGSIGDNDNSSILGGVRFYFGEAKSLKRRHREDDPQNIVTGPALSVGSSVSGVAIGKKYYN